MASNDTRVAALQRRLAELEDDIARRDQFLKLLAHELRSPLTAILGWANLLRVMPPHGERVLRGAEAIERSAQVQVKLLDDLVSATSLATGTLRLDRQPVYLTPIVAGAVHIASPAARDRSIFIVLDADAHGGTILGDAARIQQLISNVLACAVHLADAPGRVHVAINRDDVRTEVRIFYISPDDTPPTREDVLERTQAIERDLGVQIARDLARLHGGGLEIATSSLSNAFAFTVTLPLLPLAMNAQDTRTTVTVTHDECAGMRVLVVDDEHDARALVSEVLINHGAQVDVAESTLLALTALSKSKYDVLVSDLSMPFDDGFMLIEQLRREQGPNRRTPAVALTAHASAEMRERVAAATFAAYLIKPIAPTALVNVVATIGKNVELQ